MHALEEIVSRHKKGEHAGIYSCCSANEYVLLAAMERAKRHGIPVLIESTANQVDQFGGYTGMKPADFYAHCYALARRVGLDERFLILGGDHLGPLTWSKRSEQEAMDNAQELVRAYVLAGFTKIHIDTSMRLGSDSPSAPLGDETIAQRGALLAAAAEQAYRERKKTVPGAQEPVYVIGSEVPIPGGAQEAEKGVEVTKPEDARATIAAYESEFARRGLREALKRVVAVVVQPGVEFGDTDVFAYDRQKARALTSLLADYPSLVFEGHSTDYQTPQKLREMVEDGIAILKVGPALTFALREALCALECIENALFAGKSVWKSDFAATLETAMLENPVHWQKHYHGNGVDQRFSRLYSFSDRARYYLPDPAVNASVERLLKNLSGITIPYSLLSQFLQAQYAKVREGVLANDPAELLKDRVGQCIDEYLFAVLA